MTPTEAAIDNLRNEAQRPNSIHAAEIALLLAERDRYENALREIAAPHDCGCVPCREQCLSPIALQAELSGRRDLALEALRCE